MIRPILFSRIEKSSSARPQQNYHHNMYVFQISYPNFSLKNETETEESSA